MRVRTIAGRESAQAQTGRSARRSRSENVGRRAKQNAPRGHRYALCGRLSGAPKIRRERGPAVLKAKSMPGRAGRDISAEHAGRYVAAKSYIANLARPNDLPKAHCGILPDRADQFA